MQIRSQHTILVCLLALSAAARIHAAIGVRLLLGVTDTNEVKWDGSATAHGARIASIEPWRFDIGDALSGDNSWQISTHRIRLFGGGLLVPPNFVANGVILWLDNADDSTELQVKTTQGGFDLRLRDIPFGKALFTLNGRVMADRIPGVSQITHSPNEQDYPAAATDKTGAVWLAYVEFRHNPDHDKLRANYRTPPSDLSDRKAPTGGDQILARRYSGGSWSDPIAITAPGGDLYRAAIAVDGAGRPWVFWAANQNGNFDIWARAIENGVPGKTVRVTTEAGSDIDPVATTDAKGRVWVAWQGWRNGKAAIFAATQNGSAFSKPVTVSSSGANEWNPAIAADASGAVTVAWDSYRNGNYDVYLRTASPSGSWGRELAVAATPRYEAYPSIAYDPAGRLWVAYEEGGERWGKDFGAYDSQGVALYQGRAIRLRGFEKDGKTIEPKDDPAGILPGVPNRRADIMGKQSELTEWLKPNPAAAPNRGNARAAPAPQSPKNTLPRLRFDSSGRLWLAFRSAHPIWWNLVGTVWTEFVTSYDGNAWTAPVFLSHSDNLLDNRPALASTRAGEIMVIGSSDSRRQFHRVGPAAAGGMQLDGSVPQDPYNNDLYVNTIDLAPATAPIAVKASPAPTTPAMDSMNKAEGASIANFRSHRAKPDNLRVVRGEFHRHSEISMDGGSDGTILDQWRYILDTAALDWVGCCDHDNGGGREYSWWITQKLTDIFYAPGKFVPMFNYERSVAYPEGHRNVIFAQRGIRTLPRLPKMDPESSGHAPDTELLYRYLKEFNGIVASHTSATNMGTDWRDNDPVVEPVVEIYQGDRQNYEMPGAPRSNSEKDSIGGWRPKGFVNLALERGYKLSFQASSDHVSTHMSYCNIFVTDGTRQAVLDGLKKRHVYGATDNILAEFRSGDHMMGDAFSTSQMPEVRLQLWGTAPFAKVHVIKDNQYVYSIEPKKANVDFTWRDNAAQAGKTGYYYVRGEQENGEIVWVSPMWITYTGR